MRKGHVHAELIAEYAKDAANYENPWDQWEYCHADRWQPCPTHPKWLKNVKYRRIQKSILENLSYPEPQRHSLRSGQEYWWVSISMPTLATKKIWVGEEVDHRLLRRGLVHLSKENAIEHAKALIRASKGYPCQYFGTE